VLAIHNLDFAPWTATPLRKGFPEVINAKADAVQVVKIARPSSPQSIICLPPALERTFRNVEAHVSEAKYHEAARGDNRCAQNRYQSAAQGCCNYARDNDNSRRGRGVVTPTSWAIA